MAKAGQGDGGAGSLKAELTCSICLGLFREPVLLSCGHSFCRQCLRKAESLGALRYSTASYTCPTCRVYHQDIPHKNFHLDNIVKAFKATTCKRQEDEDSEEWDRDAVPCEYCLDRVQPAVKTCLVCEASLCQAHLSKHDAKASQQEHVLVEVGAGEADERRCREHGKLLECYCREDAKCICVLCSIAGAHKGHEVITMKEERDKQLDKLSDPMTKLEACKTDLVTALKELQKSEDQVKTNTRTVTSQLEELFKNIITEVVQKKKKILSDIRSNEEEQLAEIAEARKEMEEKRKQAEQNLQALQKIKEQPDVFLFFKELKLLTDRIESLDTSTESADVEEVQLDQSRIAQCQSLREKLMCQLESVLEDARDKLLNQTDWSKCQGRLSRLYETAHILTRRLQRLRTLQNISVQKYQLLLRTLTWGS